MLRKKKNCGCTNNDSQISKTYDYVIVGLGTAGAVLARKLTDDHQNSVLVLEIGRNRTDDPLVKNPTPVSPVSTTDLTFNPKYSVNYTVPTYPTSTLPIEEWFPPFLQSVSYSESRMWGGGSAHNYLATVRGTPPIYDQWAAASGNPQWAYDNVLATMKAIETFTPNGTILDAAQRGTTGPIQVNQSPPVTTDPIALAISIATGTAITDDYNDETLGYNSVSSNQSFVTPGPNSERSFSIPAYLTIGQIIDAEGNGLHGRQLKIKSSALVSKVIFDGNKAVGVEYIKNHGLSNSFVDRVYARKKVILCAGAINTPAILQRSGVGDSVTLNGLDIPIIANSPNVGKNLQNHYGPEGTVVNVPESVPTNAIAFVNGAPYFPNDQTRRMEIVPNFLAPGVFQFLDFNVDPASRGSVTIVDTNPVIQPKLDLNMYSDAGGIDALNAVSFYKLLTAISANLPGSIVVYPTPADYAGGDPGLLNAAKNISVTGVGDHIAGTTQMGTDISNGVVDGNLHVFGTTNLMIADLGIAPKINNGNTCFPVYVIGNVAADIIRREQWRKKNNSYHC